MQNVYFNDTFDNFSFNCSELTKSGSSKPTSSNSKFYQNISIDDSVFLSDSFSFTEKVEEPNNVESFIEPVSPEDIANPTTPSRSNRKLSKSRYSIYRQLDITVNSPRALPESVHSPVDPMVNGQRSLSKSTSLSPLKEKSINTLYDPEVFSKSIQQSPIRESNSTINNLKVSAELNEEPLKRKLFDNIPEVSKRINNFSESRNSIKNVENDVKANQIESAVSLALWGLPEAMLEKYKEKSIVSMFPWQVECLSLPGVLDQHKNLVYSAPTSAGKTLVAEILAIKTVLERKRKVIFILPFVSVVREKMFYFQNVLSSSGIRVDGMMGSYNPPGGFRTVQLAVCTIEKANALINRLLAEDGLDKIGAVIVDEMHLLGDSGRGYLLELLLTKLRYMTLKSDEVNIQIVGMSATLPNLNLLAKWLDAALYTTNFRPIPLNEQCFVQGEIYDGNFKLLRKLQSMPELGVDTDNIFQLCLETIFSSCSVLIFCPTKVWCESLAQQIAVAFWKLGSTHCELGIKLREQLSTQMIKECLEQLKHCPVGLDPILAKTVSFAVAFHHAGLTMDERDIIEAAFRNTCIRVLIATSTLSSGVNLPARRVIIRSPKFHGRPIDTLTYRQMIGRAGRMGKDTAGESILICQKTDYVLAKELMSAHLQPIESCLEGAGKLKRAILEVIASNVASSPEEVNLFTRCTLLANDEENELCNPIQDSIEFLTNNQFIRLQTMEDGSSRYRPTSLAKACLNSALPPEEGLALFTELEKARQCFVLENELHLVYLVTPYTACNQLGEIDWMVYLDKWEKLPISMKRVGELVGVKISYIISATRKKPVTNTSKLYHKLQIHKRFYTALALQDLVNEVPLGEVAVRFNCNRGMLQSLQQSAATFAGMVTSFSKQLGWSCVELLVAQFQDRLQFGISRDLLELMKLPVLNGQRARAIFDAGIENLVDLASTSVSTLENILHKMKPFESDKEREGESEYEAKQRNNIRTIWVTGKQGLTEKEAAEMLVKDARDYLKYELGLSDAKWDQSEESKEFEFKTPLNRSKASLSAGDQSDNERNVSERYSLRSNSNSLINLSNSLLNSSTESICNKKNKTKRKSHTVSLNNNISLNSTSESITKTESPDISKSSNESRYNLRSRNSSKSKLNVSEEMFFDDSMDFQAIENLSNIEGKKQTNSSINTNACVEEGFISSFGNKTPKRARDLIEKDDERDIKKFKLDTSIETPLDFSKVEIVDVCIDTKLFETFTKEILTKDEMSLSVACEKIVEQKAVIGQQIINRENNVSDSDKINFELKTRRVIGVAISCGDNVVYYMDLQTTVGVGEDDKIAMLNSILERQELNVRLFDAKEQIKVLQCCCGLEFQSKCYDPKVADWLLEPEGKEKNLQAMTLNYLPEAVSLCQIAGNSKGSGSVALDLHSSIDGKVRASVESAITWHTLNSLVEVMKEQDVNLLEVFKTEMMVIKILAKMELTGFSVNINDMQKLVHEVKDHIAAVETKAFQLVGRRFSFTSSADVAKVLGIYKGKRVSTNKQVLEQSARPVSNLIILWRKLHSILVKAVYPLLKSTEYGRIHGLCITHTATGRITMHEPNLQSIVRDFEFTDPVTNANTRFSCRKVFKVQEKMVLLSADYCQLELRVLSHLTQDPILCGIMATDGDVFRSIAASWNNIRENEVTEEIRHQAKHICYGIIYGMGHRALAEQLSISEEEASSFTETFHETYPAIKKYISTVVLKCREAGYVQTICGRKRFLAHINHSNSAIRHQAERQAVNTTIQGSAADIAKKAMVLVDQRISDKFKASRNKPRLVLQLHDELMYEVPGKYLQCLAKLLKRAMEECVVLSVPFPVKLKSGASWGEMKELIL